MIGWSDVRHIKIASKVPFRDGKLIITEQELAVWKLYPSAIFEICRHVPLFGDVHYLLTKWHVPESACHSDQFG
jgi:ferredoxin-NADP reductase